MSGPEAGRTFFAPVGRACPRAVRCPNSSPSPPLGERAGVRGFAVSSLRISQGPVRETCKGQAKDTQRTCEAAHGCGMDVSHNFFTANHLSHFLAQWMRFICSSAGRSTATATRAGRAVPARRTATVKFYAALACFKRFYAVFYHMVSPLFSVSVQLTRGQLPN